MNGRNAIVVVVDRLGAGYLAPYGNTWLETPAFNRLASQSLLWEFAWSTAPTVAGAYQAISTGQHPLAAGASSCRRLWDRLHVESIHSAVVTDDPGIQSLAVSDTFADRVFVNPEPVRSAAKTWDQTQLCQLFLTSFDWLSRAPDRFCLLLHSRGMSGPWDAPPEFRTRFADEEDPPVPDFIEPPNRFLGAQADPDEIWGVTQAYAGQIVAVDRCLEMLLEFLEERALLDSTLVIVTSPRGFPLGERGGLGEYGDELSEELLHVPMFIRRPDHVHVMERCQSLVELTDLHATLWEWLAGEKGEASVNPQSLLAPTKPGEALSREFVTAVLGESLAIRTPAWFLKQVPGRKTELYAKPDDRWEINQVADRCGDLAEELGAVLAAFADGLRSGQPALVPALPAHLLRRAD